MASFTPKTWLARQGTGLNKFRIGNEVAEITPHPDSITQAGDQFTAANMNDLEQRISSAFGDVGAGTFTYVIANQDQFNAWQNNTAGNDYTSVAICAGTYTQTKMISVSVQGTRFAKGFGAKISAQMTEGTCFAGIAMIETLDIIGFSVYGITGEAEIFLECGLRDIRIDIASYTSGFGLTCISRCGGEYGTIIDGIFIKIESSTYYSISGMHYCSDISDAYVVISNSRSGQAMAYYHSKKMSNCSCNVSASGHNGIGFSYCDLLTGCASIANNICYGSCKGMVGNTAVKSYSGATAFSNCQVYYTASTPTPSASGNGGNNYTYNAY